ncbi:MAG TPA: MtnX-like HAD-IB family phosphatase [Terriglobia bacterium]|nr:MtnX-like HAD-IB family phosphatase [Terriglobia bacterium]
MPNLTRDFTPVVFCDFDGTITQLDVTDQILTQLAHPSWREIEQQWMQGMIGSRECLERQIALVDAPAEDLLAIIDAAAVDGDFAAFCKFARKKRLPLYLVSDGFDYVIRRVLKRAGVDRQFRSGLNLFASALRVEGRRLAPSFPHSPEPCAHGCATCKSGLIRRLREGRQPVIFVGDGMSDRFAVEVADVVFAKRHLLAYCRESGIACHPFETFKDVQVTLEKLLAPAPARRFRQAVAAVS